MSMAFTKEQFIAIAKELWGWLAETGAQSKNDWPGWLKYGKMINSCPLCEYALDLSTVEVKCEVCPYYQKFGDCQEATNPYLKWLNAFDSKKTKSQYAKLFLAQLEEL